ncbi:glycosyltransferase [Lactobacillus ultunensis]|uniref:Glycosyltransferase, group 1 family protein n=1 Tax=Lactobacillus ultunensis DSM 16047 TaxID=525365 RepID=C2EPK8_9LACO|nr:glycosyltransferase [Lactobacillus ultunensis]EEJ71584.1 glycosyltransferase, group 1 family protein [Lactobacillus ultunensis DSM 16047]KRL82366.1 capsular polysaccharide biosynthsis protein [Lactobacillus ultunensis DSM 16047]QQP28321.1 glycosyltransferase [Lactobacillus ultunensis]
MKKLLVVAKSLGGGGSEVALIEFLNRLDEKKYNITLLLLDKDTEYSYRLKKKIKIEYIKFDNKFYHSLASMYALPGKAIKKIGLNKYFPIYDVIAKHSRMPFLPHYDVAIDFYGYGAFTTAFLALNVNADKKAFWLHDEQMPWIVNVERYFSNYSKIFGVSKAIKKTFDSLYPHYREKSDVFYNVIDIKNILKKSIEFYPKEFKNNIFNIVTVGRLTEQKGYDLSVKAAKRLKDEGIHFKWFAIGEGKDRRKLERLIHKLNLNNNFILLGRRDNPYPYIKNCNLFVLPSRHEGYSVALVEARILKKCIVTSDFPANVEQIDNGKTGLISKLNDKDLENCIKKLYLDSKLRDKLEKNVTKENINFDGQINKISNI